uniref:Uncharacterized protein n=1 Tax=Picea glauca TaxID=3330 RepID=A0A117NFS5_PICGL|nr:hypothetical protein ABT39_MTgene2486 [Picea glauca]KUM45671.1 hypothetical protein ABT39_MTgene2507 [Picea glauca]KUM45676.1 hypothetical protein ABT39_MTgene2512 [Picea glauca]
MFQERYLKSMAVEVYNGDTDPFVYVEHCTQHWEIEGLRSDLWVNKFIHNLGPIPQDWYLHEETRRQTRDWKTLQTQFCEDLSFLGKSESVQVSLLAALTAHWSRPETK